MSTQFLLDENDIKELTKLMLVMIETQESRKQLCRELGINPQEVSFIIGTSDDTFCTELIDSLNRYGYQENLCKLCCDKLFPILNKSVYSHRISILKKIIEKINCNCNHKKQNHPIPIVPNPDELKSESWFTKIGNVNKKLLGGGAILLIGLAGFPIYYSIQKPHTKIIYNDSPGNDIIKYEYTNEEDCIKRCEKETGCVGVVTSPNNECWLKAHINSSLIENPSRTTIQIR
ncbi:hypothetical protein NIES2100_03270 [Calothrix sp. NIES-2100]|uniref:hypothetical protein n=1 Tax=Calothrix sp. NIES-2100 TaxID=1954172 RepID=UPI000B621A10|nr:hypothetical protein NIES2100_03270 [Calothrix sp. NIES-2100]